MIVGQMSCNKPIPFSLKGQNESRNVSSDSLFDSFVGALPKIISDSQTPIAEWDNKEVLASGLSTRSLNTPMEGAENKVPLLDFVKRMNSLNGQESKEVSSVSPRNREAFPVISIEQPSTECDSIEQAAVFVESISPDSVAKKKQSIILIISTLQNEMIDLENSVSESETLVDQKKQSLDLLKNFERIEKVIQEIQLKYCAYIRINNLCENFLKNIQENKLYFSLIEVFKRIANVKKLNENRVELNEVIKSINSSPLTMWPSTEFGLLKELKENDETLENVVLYLLLANYSFDLKKDQVFARREGEEEFDDFYLKKIQKKLIELSPEQKQYLLKSPIPQIRISNCDLLKGVINDPTVNLTKEFDASLLGEFFSLCAEGLLKNIEPTKLEDASRYLRVEGLCSAFRRMIGYSSSEVVEEALLVIKNELKSLSKDQKDFLITTSTPIFQPSHQNLWKTTRSNRVLKNAIENPDSLIVEFPYRLLEILCKRSSEELLK